MATKIKKVSDMPAKKTRAGKPRKAILEAMANGVPESHLGDVVVDLKKTKKPKVKPLGQNVRGPSCVLSDMEFNFAHAILKHPNEPLGKLLVHCGYKGKNPQGDAQKLSKKPSVMAEIDRMRQLVREETAVQVASLLATAHELLDMCMARKKVKKTHISSFMGQTIADEVEGFFFEPAAARTTLEMMLKVHGAFQKDNSQKTNSELEFLRSVLGPVLEPKNIVDMGNAIQDVESSLDTTGSSKPVLKSSASMFSDIPLEPGPSENGMEGLSFD